MKKLALLFMILLPTYGYPNWGGTTYRNATDTKAGFIRADLATYNNGTLVTGSVGNGNPATQKYKNYLFDFAAGDMRTAGYTQDSALFYIYYDESDTGWIYGYALKVAYGEGNEAGATADSGDCDWTAAFTKSDASDSIAWAGAGCTGAADRSASPICSLYIGTSDVAGYKVFRIAGAYVTADLATYGLVLECGAMATTYCTMNFATDDRGTEAQRPYMIGYESPPSGTPKRKRNAP